MRLSAVLVLLLSGCAAEPVARSIVPPSGTDSSVRLWVDPNEIKGKTLDGIRSLNIGCVYSLKPESRQECLMLLFQIYNQYEGRQYLYEIAANWLSTSHPIGIIDKGNMITIPSCEDQWQFGDLTDQTRRSGRNTRTLGVQTLRRSY